MAWGKKSQYELKRDAQRARAKQQRDAQVQAHEDTNIRGIEKTESSMTVHESGVFVSFSPHVPSGAFDDTVATVEDCEGDGRSDTAS